MAIKYRVSEMRAGGLEARWSRTRTGLPIMVGRKPGDKTWWALSNRFFVRAQSVGIMEAFEEMTITSEFFSIPI